VKAGSSALVPRSYDRRGNELLEALERGLCIVVGLRDGSLLNPFADRSRYRVLAFDDRSDRLAKILAELHEEDFYGGLVTVHFAKSLAK